MELIKGLDDPQTLKASEKELLDLPKGPLIVNLVQMLKYLNDNLEPQYLKDTQQCSIILKNILRHKDT
jgi:hypothetical protein